MLFDKRCGESHDFSGVPCIDLIPDWTRKDLFCFWMSPWASSIILINPASIFGYMTCHWTKNFRRKAIRRTHFKLLNNSFNFFFAYSVHPDAKCLVKSTNAYIFYIPSFYVWHFSHFLRQYHTISVHVGICNMCIHATCND